MRNDYHEHYPRLTNYGLMQNVDHIYSPKKRYYAAKQLYRFVRPGARRISSSVDSSNLIVSTFYDGTRGELILVGVKQGGPDSVEIHLSGSDQMPSRWDLYQTTLLLNCVKTDEINGKNDMV